MRNFEFYSPIRYLFGKGEHLKAGLLAKEYGATKVLILYGGGSIKKTGLYDTIVNCLENEGLQHVSLGGVQPNPVSTLVYRGIDLCKEEGVDFILAVGGGSTIDSAKAIAMGARCDHDFWDFYEHKRVAVDAIPIGTVLTLPAAGSESDPGTVITLAEKKLKRDCNFPCLFPKFSIMNPELTFTLPPYQTACGCVDIMAHAMERYFTQVKGADFSDKMLEAVMLSIVHNAPLVLQDPENYCARANIMWASSVVQNNMLGMGREEDWASHLIEHELSGLYDVAHGAGLSVVFPAWMEYQMEANVGLFAQFATRIMGVEYDRDAPHLTALEGIARLKRFWRSLGMPTTMEEIGARSEDVQYLAKMVNYNADGYVSALRPLYKQDVEKILYSAFEK